MAACIPAIEFLATVSIASETDFNSFFVDSAADACNLLRSLTILFSVSMICFSRVLEKGLRISSVLSLFNCAVNSATGVDIFSPDNFSSEVCAASPASIIARRSACICALVFALPVAITLKNFSKRCEKESIPSLLKNAPNAPPNRNSAAPALAKKLGSAPTNSPPTLTVVLKDSLSFCASSNAFPSFPIATTASLAVVTTPVKLSSSPEDINSSLKLFDSRSVAPAKFSCRVFTSFVRLS